MKICISGLTASGKTTLSEKISNELGVKHVQNSYKEYIKSHELMADFIDSADERFVRDFDRKTVNATSTDCVVSTWLGPWLVKDATLRAWLYAPDEIRAKRYAERHMIGLADARELIASTDSSAARGFKRVYGIDIYDQSIFDIQLNTSTTSIRECVSVLSLMVIEREKR